jgi:hypothetical protein
MGSEGRELLIGFFDRSLPWESRQITRRMIERWIDNRHMAVWRVLASSQRQARELILGP